MNDPLPLRRTVDLRVPEQGHEEGEAVARIGQGDPSFLTVLNSQGTTPDLPIGSCQGWDALGRGGAAVDQRPLTIDEDRHRETRRSGSYPKNRVCVCVRAGEGEGVRGRVGACVGVGCVCGCVVYRILRVRGEEAGFRAVG